MTKVKICNFQSITDVDFVIDGFTVIVGKNNIGKSAIIRSIDAALTNQAGKRFIRKGTKKTDISISYPGMDLHWSKAEETSSYKINGKSYSKLNRNIPDEITSAGFRKIEVGTEKLNPLLASQFNPLFLLDRPGSVITDALSAIYKLNILSTADTLCQKELKDKKSSIKTREHDLAYISETLEKFKDFDTLKTNMADAHTLNKKNEDTQNKLNELNVYIKKIEDTSTKIKKLKPVSQIKIPDYKPAEEKYKQIQWISGKISEHKKIEGFITTLQKAISIEIPNLIEYKKRVSSLQEINKLYMELKNLITSLKNKQTIMGALKEIPNISETSNKIKTLKTLDKDYSNLYESASLVKNLKKNFESASVNLEKAIKEEQEERKRLGICPLCKKPL